MFKQKTKEEMKESVSKLMSEAFLYLEFDRHFFPTATKIEDDFKTCLFALYTKGLPYAAAINKINSEHPLIWYNACIEPMFHIENVECELRPLRNGSEIIYFRCRLKNSYILANCDFK